MECELIDKSVLPCAHFVKPQYCSLPSMMLCIEARKARAPRISHSELSTYTKCLRMHWYGYMEGLERLEPPVRLLAGKIFGECADRLFSNNPNGTWQGVLTGYKARYKSEYEEVSKELMMIEGWMRALEEMPLVEEKGITQYEFRWKEMDYPQIHGFLDWVRLNGDGKPAYGKEFKYSTNADWSKFIVTPQLSTYFIPFPEMQRMDHIVFKVPYLKVKKGEGTEEFTERVYKDVKHNPKEYISKKSYWRNEFALEDTKERYRVITTELYNKLGRGKAAFYQTDNREVCFRCDYYEICSNDGVVSDQLYKKKEIRGERKT